MSPLCESVTDYAGEFTGYQHSHPFTLPSPRQAAHILSSLVLASILLPLPLHTGHVRVSGFLGLGNFRVGSFFRNLDVSWLGYQLMFKFIVKITCLFRQPHFHVSPPSLAMRPLLSRTG